MLQKKVVIALFSSLILLTACGGSDDTGADVVNDNGSNVDNDAGGDASNDNDDVNNSILKFQTFGLERIEYDYDNNGIFEGIETFNYDDEGRLVLSSYQYTEDGVQDTQATTGGTYKGYMSVENTYIYGDMGRLINTNHVYISNTSPDASSSRNSKTNDFIYEYEGDSKYPTLITENSMNENGVSTYRYTDVYDYDDENKLNSVIREYDPSISALFLNASGVLYRTENDYSDNLFSVSRFDALDQFMTGLIYDYSSEGLINSTIVTIDADMSFPPPNLTSIAEYSRNDRECLSKYSLGSYNDSGTIDYIGSTEITYGSQDRITMREFVYGLDGNVITTESYFYGDIEQTTKPYTQGQFAFPHFYLLSEETPCLTD